MYFLYLCSVRTCGLPTEKQNCMLIFTETATAGVLVVFSIVVTLPIAFHLSQQSAEYHTQGHVVVMNISTAVIRP